ncbi:hypothetical protein [Pseudoclavibacter sp. RFBB5]|uniref:hypothetical protein n=1 Tax=Pseudoclavibacter sp. RFBB5 TaxID=2080574 RepID=UPI000D4A0192|nr:hypothetical protein [Pseudoclavibacter sp. RFBB5]PPG33070.1 hypothetical protein C5B97_00070 [Pseudoclavibacter sp. RFBB5]
MPKDRNRTGMFAVLAAALLLIGIVAAAALLGTPTGWVIFIALVGFPLVLAPAALLGLRWGDARMAKAGPGVLTALGPGEIREMDVPDVPITTFGWRATLEHLPPLLPPARRRALIIAGLLGAGAGVWMTLGLTDAPEPWQTGLSAALFGVTGALVLLLVLLLAWLAIAHRDATLDRSTRRLLEQSINPANDRIRINTARLEDLQEGIDQRRAVYPLLVPIAASATVAVVAAIGAQLALSGGEEFPRMASFASMTLMLWLGLTSFGKAEQIAVALQEVRSSGGAG